MYFNEHDSNAAQWIRELFPSATVDSRDIQQVKGADIEGHRRAHFFAGIAGWEYALRLAGIPDDIPVWTGSCPCQPFSLIGNGKGTADERHLWPDFYRLIFESKPVLVFGEQVGKSTGREWLAGVQADLEHAGYTVGAANLPACSVGAPHIRERIYWGAIRLGDLQVSDAGCQRLEARSAEGSETRAVDRIGGDDSGMGVLSLLRRHVVQPASDSHGGLLLPVDRGLGGCGSILADSLWLGTESGPVPLAHGLPRGVGYSGDPSSPDYLQATAEARVMRLKGYGNAIVPHLAAVFIRCFLEAIGDILHD